MFFVLSQILDFFLTPSNVLFLALLAALALWVIKIRKLAAALGIVSIFGLALAAWSPFGLFALGVLENRFPRTTLPDDVAGIIMLGGAVDTHISFDREALVLNEAGERIVETRSLAARYPEAEIFLSGGGGHLSSDGSLTESELARRALVEAGVAAERLAMEELSRNTCENARETTAALDERAAGTWILVTSASHMRAPLHALERPILRFFHTPSISVPNARASLGPERRLMGWRQPISQCTNGLVS